MTKYLVAATAAVALCFVAGAEQAEARGFHFQSGRVHVDVGNPHRSFYGGGRSYGGGYGHTVGYGNRGYNQSFYRGAHGGGHGGHGAWHNTSHYDWHAPSLRRHGNHFDLVPGHYDYHRTGHYDRH